MINRAGEDEIDMSWDEIKTSSGKFLKIDDGDQIQVYFGEASPDKVSKHWVGGKPTECEGAGCKDCADGDSPDLKWEFPCVVVGEESEGDRILSLPPWHAIVIRDLRAKDVQKFQSSIVMVSRQGTGRQTKYWAACVGTYDPKQPF